MDTANINGAVQDLQLAREALAHAVTLLANCANKKAQDKANSFKMLLSVLVNTTANLERGA